MSTDGFFADLFPPDYWDRIDKAVPVEDRHSFFGDAEVFDWLIGVVRPTTIIELGAWKGHSANYMADCCKRLGLQTRIIAVDTFQGSVEHWFHPGMRAELHLENGRPTVFERFLGNTIARGNTDHVFPLPVDGQTAAALFRLYDVKADLVFIDAGHEYDMVREDIRRFQPLITADGVMFGDDYQDPATARAAHDGAEEAGVQLMVGMRKWMQRTGPLRGIEPPPGAEIRTSFDGWEIEHCFGDPERRAWVVADYHARVPR